MPEIEGSGSPSRLPLVVERLTGSFASARHPERNEDDFLLDLEAGVAGVLDGLGGYEGGAVAAALGRAAVVAFVCEGCPLDPIWAEAALRRAREVLREYKSQNNHPEMGATAVLAARASGCGRVGVAWCGDSRAYSVDTMGKLVRLTRDHGELYELVEGGSVSEREAEHLTQVLDGAEGASEAWRRGGGRAKKLFQHRNLVVSELSDGPVCRRCGKCTELITKSAQAPSRVSAL